MTPEEIEAAMHRLNTDVSIWLNERAGRTPREFTTWFWERADDIKAQFPPQLADVGMEQLYDIVDGALDAGLFGREGEEDVPFPE